MAKRGSDEWKKKLRDLKLEATPNSRIKFQCDYCGRDKEERQSHYNKTKRHFCCRDCYAKFVAERLPREEQNSYGSGNSPEERIKRKNTRSILNHYLRDNHIEKGVCEVCGKKAEAHHDDYNEPLEIRWLCMKHHREWHKRHDNPELLMQ
jgi:hypothetical protein